MVIGCYDFLHRVNPDILCVLMVSSPLATVRWKMQDEGVSAVCHSFVKEKADQTICLCFFTKRYRKNKPKQKENE